MIILGDKPTYPDKTERIEPTPCPMCGNYRLEINGKVECRQEWWCREQLGDKWHGKWQKVTTLYEYFDEKPEQVDELNK